MTYEIVSVTTTEILVQLSFDEPILISQAQIADQVVVKMNKDFFLVPKRIAGGNTVVDEDEDPYRYIDSQLPKMLTS